MPDHFTFFDALSIFNWFFSAGVLGMVIWSLRKRVSKIAIPLGYLVAIVSLFELVMAFHYFPPTSETINVDLVRLMIIASAALMSLAAGLIVALASALKRA